MKDWGDVLDYVRSVFPDADPLAQELYGGVSCFREARRSDMCSTDCPGERSCPYYGISAKVFLEQLGGKRVFVVRSNRCAQSRAQAEQKRLRNLVAASRIPPELAACSFDNYKPQNEATKAAKYLAMHCADHGEGILLGGAPGVGKTHLAVSIVQSVVAAGRSAVFVPVVNLLDEMKDAVVYGRIEKMLEALREVDCLAIDDLGMQKDSEWVGERLYELVNDRYNAKKQLVVTTNARSSKDLESMIGKSGRQIASRLREMTAIAIIDADDFRMRKKGQAKQQELIPEAILQ